MPRIKLSRRRTLLFATLTIVAGVVTISACSTEENPPAGSLSLALSPTSVNVVPGGSGTVAATITRGGSFTGDVTLTASGNPTGVTVTFTPDVIPGAATSATVDIAVGAAVTPGDITITINAAGTGVTTATATLTVAVVPASNGAIALAADPGAVTANVGGATVTSVITVTRTAPFAGPVALTVTGAPAGVTATVNPTSVTAAATSTLSVQATAGAVNGLYPLVIHGAGTGVANATATVNVTVAGGAAQGASFTFNPTSVPITAGGASGTSVVTVTRSGGFIGSLNLAITGQPAGMTATVAPNPNLNTATSTVTVQATAAVAAGTYNLTLTGTGTGIPNATGTLPVVVSAAGGGGNFTVAFCTADAPIWVAAQDGTGAWTRVLPNAGTSTYQFAFPSGEGGVALVDTVGTGTDLTVVYASTAEFTALGGTANFSGCGAKTINGTVANVGAGEAANVSLGFSSTATSFGNPGPPAFPAFVLNNVAEGNQDLFAARTNFITANKVILRRNLNILGGGSLAVLDFNAAEAFVPATANVTVTNLGSDEAAIISSFAGVYGSRLSGALGFTTSYTSASGAVPYTAIPVAQLTNALELSQLSAFAADPANPNPTTQRIAGVYFRTPADKTIALGPAPGTPTVTKLVTAPNARPRVQLASQAQYNRLFSALYANTPSNGRAANVFATAGYFGTLPATWDITLPDLSGAAGWNTAWGLLDGTGIDWDVFVQGGAIQFLDANSIVDGSTFQSASLSSSTPLMLRAARGGTDAFALQRRLLDILGQRNRSPLQ